MDIVQPASKQLIIDCQVSFLKTCIPKRLLHEQILDKIEIGIHAS